MEKILKTTTMNQDFALLKGQELISLRGISQKTFDLGKGRRQAISYGEPVHFSSAGKLIDIDNRLIRDEKSNALRTTANAYETALAIKDDGKAIVTLSRDGVAFPLSYLGETTGTVGEILEPEKYEHATEQEARADLSATLHSGVKYTELRPGMDVEIHIDGKGIKDNIILKNPDALAYAGLVLPEDFEYKQDKNGGTSVLLRGEEYIRILAPCAYDAKGVEVKVASRLNRGFLLYEVENVGTVLFPITIDPCISYSDTADSMQSAYIADSNPNSNYSSDGTLRCGKSGNANFIDLLKPTMLVGQKSSDTLLSAKLYLRTSAYGSTYEYIGVYPVLNSWSQNSVTWNSMTPTTEDHISKALTGYVSKTATSSNAHPWSEYDITEHYRSWYKKDVNGNSSINGVALRWILGGSYAEFYSTRSSINKPYIVVNYVSHAGRKSWWEYQNADCGRAGTVYADLFNGNLIAEHEDTTTVGSRMPVSLSHIYNSCLSDDNSVYCGLGWRLNLTQSLRKETILSQAYYIWQDGDGTEHYFEISGNQPYTDSEGMQLKLSVNSNSITITDKSDTVMSFPLVSSGTKVYLQSVADANGNTMTLAYVSGSAGKLSLVTDGVGRVTTLTYNSNGQLAAITAPGCPVVNFSYSGSASAGWRLTRVNYGDLPNTQFTEYLYDTYGGTMITATLTGLKNFDGLKTDVVYDTDLNTSFIGNYTEQTRHVVSIEQANGSTKGTRMLITYGNMHTTVKHVSGTASDSEGKSIVYHFNSAGNVVSTHDEMWHALAAEYDSGLDNMPSSASRLIKSVINRLPNIDFYSGWTQIKESTSDTCTWDNTVLCMNMPSVKVIKNGTGELREEISVKLFTSGMYNLSAYLKTDGLTTNGSEKGAFLRVTANGNTYESRAAQSATSGKGIGTFAEGWERLDVCFPFTYGVNTAVTVSLVCDSDAGTLYWSCPQLEEGRLANQFNMVSDGDFSLTVDNTAGSVTRLFPEKWSVVGSGVSTSELNGVITDREINGMPDSVSGNALRFTCNPLSSDVYMVQEIYSKGLKNDILTVSGWCKALSVASGTGNFEPRIGISYLDTSVSPATWTDWYRYNFGTERSGWRCISKQISVPKPYRRLRIGVFYGKNDNTAMFTHISLGKELFGESYTYDDKGNIVSVKELTSQQSAATYDSQNNLLSYVQPGSASTDKYLFTFGDTEAEQKRHLPRTTTTPEGEKTATTYDSYGNALTSTIQENATAPLIRTEMEYTADGNYVVKQKDARGNEVTNALDANGKVLSVTDPAGQQVGYTYDSSNRVTKVETVFTQDGQTRTSKNEYTYENDRIKTVSHNTTDNNTSDVRYTFNYDSLGRKISVTVSNGQSGATEHPLSTNIYSNDRKSRLEEVQYGNGGKEKYSYDEFDRVTGVTHDNDTDPKFTYEYDAKGRAAVVTDTRDGSKIRNNYDQTDRPTESEQRDGNDDLKYRTLIEYDQKNRVSVFNEATDGETHKAEYTYDADNRVTQVKYDGSDSAKVNYTYDKLNRITQRSVTNGAAYATQYGYAQGAADYGSNATTPLINAITQGSGANALNFSYTYDSRGNITSETRNGVTTTYEYDALGQLVRVNDPNDKTVGNTGTTWIYTYDRGGNILSKTAYAYTTGEPDLDVITKLYEYNDDNWKDKLTKFDGHTITYDAIGNPLSDGMWTYTWQAGRQLKSMSKVEGGNTVTMEFTYNHAGLRTKKVKKVNGTVKETTEYILNGKNLVELIHTDHVTNVANGLHFFYDAQDKQAMVEFNKVKYSYAYNLQGDVIGIVDNTGNLVVEYRYDAWGKLIGITASSTLTTEMAELNPFRYRGYIWDQETCLYYLQSRYYNATEGRFLNKDSNDPFEEPTIGGLFIYSNTYGYCNNCPVAFIDPRGKWFHILVGAIIGAAIGVVSTIVLGGDIVDTIISGAAGAAGGALAATGCWVGCQIAGSAAISFVSNIAQQKYHIAKGEQNGFNYSDLIADTAIGALAGALGGNGASYGSSAHINACGKRLLKKGITGITKKSWKYYASQAHVAGGEFVLEELKKSLGYNVLTTIVQIVD